MQILPDGRVQIKNKKTGAVKIVTPNELPQYGISPDSYTSQKMILDEKIKAYQAGAIPKDKAYAEGVPVDALTAKQPTGDVITQIQGLPTVGERNSAIATKDILDVINQAITKSKKQDGKQVPTGPISAIVSGVKTKLGAVDETSQLNKDLAEILRTIRKESTGVAFSPQEIKDLEKEIPTIWQQEANVEDSLARLKGRMLGKLTNQGIDVSNEMSPSSNRMKVGRFEVEY